MAESTLKSTLLDLLPDKANKARIYGSSAPRLLVSSRKTPPRHTEPRHTEPRHADIDALVVIGDNVEIEIQDEHTEVESNTYWESGWMRFSDALPRPWETETIAGLISKCPLLLDEEVMGLTTRSSPDSRAVACPSSWAFQAQTHQNTTRSE